MSTVAGKVFLLFFVVISIVAFVGVAAFIEMHNSPVDATINSSMDSYYNTSQAVNQTMNSTLHYAQVATQANSSFPMLIMICVICSALFLFLLAGKRR
jgi:hypothetical protein